MRDVWVSGGRVIRVQSLLDAVAAFSLINMVGLALIVGPMLLLVRKMGKRRRFACARAALLGVMFSPLTGAVSGTLLSSWLLSRPGARNLEPEA